MDSRQDSPAAGMEGLPPTEPVAPPRPRDGEVPGSTARPPRPHEEKLARGASLGRYLVLERLGAGGMGVVYAAYDPELDRSVALKLLRGGNDPGARARLLREAQAMARLQHPNVIAVHDVGTVGDEVFIAMELVRGRTLGTLLEEERPPLPRVLALFRQAGEGMAAAHAAGLVHRDFKPHNVLVGDDGRARVLDFGLARGVAAAAEAPDPPLEPVEPHDAITPTPAARPAAPGTDPSRSSARGGLLATPLTRVGSVIGTPAYIAPEHFAGAPADARSDQYSFCVALYEALYGEHPYRPPGGRLPELLAAARLGDVRPPPEGRAAPKWLRRAVLRGLSPHPEERWPDMRALLAALDRDPAALRRRWMLGAGVAALALAAASGLALHLRQQALLCSGAEAALVGIWDEPRKGALRAAFLATAASYAPTSWRGVEAALDDYAGGWRQMRTEACEATRVRGEQSEELLDLRMSCLDARREELRALGELLARPDASLVENAVSTARALAPLDECADRAALTAAVRPPPEPERRARVEALRARLARGNVLFDAGRYEPALALTLPVVGEARRLAYRPLEAEALTLAGALHNAAGDYDAAERELLDAVLAAEAARDRRTAARASSLLVHVIGYRHARFPEGHLWARHAAAALEGDPRAREGEAYLANQLGNLLHKEGRPAAAIAQQRRALDLYAAATGRESLDTATALNSLANALRRSGEPEQAQELLRRALAVREKALGADHPLVGHTLHNLGTAEVARGRYAAAEPLYLRALALFERSLGPDNALVAITANNLAEVAMYTGRLDEAERWMERSLAIDRAQLGADHPDVGIGLSNLGEIQERAGRLDQALDSYRRALAIKERALGPDHPSLGITLQAIAEVSIERGEAAAALPLAERAVRVLARGGEPLHLAGARFVLAKALWETGRDRRGAVALARRARDGFVAEGEAGRLDLAEVDAWLAGRERHRNRRRAQIPNPDISSASSDRLR